MANGLAFDPNTPTELQRQDWTCSIRSVMWMLKSLGIPVTPEDAQDAMSPKYVTPELGLLDASGAGMVAALQDTWGVGAVNDANATFDEVVAVAGRQPVAIGLRNWGGPGYGHWSAVRGVQDLRLVLANPGGTGPRFGQQTLTRAEFDERGPASMVTIPLGPRGVEPAPPAATPDPWQWFSADQIAVISQCKIDGVREHWPRLVEQLAHCGINTRPAQIAMIATVAVETAHRFAPIHEFRNADGSLPAHWQTYDGGPDYHGRGFIQLTHRYNYAAYGLKIAALWGTSPDQPDFDLVGDPDRALDPDISAAVSALYFRDHGGDGQGRIPMAAAIGNWQEVRRLVQGGNAGLEEVTRIANALTALPLPGQQAEPPIVLPPAADTRVERIRAKLREALAIAEEPAPV